MGRDNKEFPPQNSLLLEAKVAKQLQGLQLNIPTPTVVFVSVDPEMYCYRYLEGVPMIQVWQTLSQQERLKVCQDLGKFHSEIGKKFTKAMAQMIGLEIENTPYLHPEVEKEYHLLVTRSDLPNHIKVLAKTAKQIFDQTLHTGIFHFIHNDAHHENILIKNTTISGIIDFGEAMYGEVAKEFSRYIRDYPNYVEDIINAYEQESGNKLSRPRLISNALLSGLSDIIEAHQQGGEEQQKAEKMLERYQEMLTK